ncbi:MAG: PKD domain-containing protein [Flavihumibacter sp.]
MTKHQNPIKTRVTIFLPVILLMTWQLGYAQAPQANFNVSVTEGCSPLSVSFTNTSTNATSFTWDLGNGTFSTNKNAWASYQYNPSGNNTYTITLNAKSASGVINQFQKTVTVYPSPQADFTVNQSIACVPATINFTDHSTDPSGSPVTSYLWDFGDGTTSTEANPSHTFSNVGYYNVSLTVTGSGGCTNMKLKQRVVRMIGSVAPNFEFTTGAICQTPVNVLFSNQTAGAGTMTYQWTLGNGSQSTATNPTTTYPAYGSYDVKLVAISSYGCRDSIIKPINLVENITSFSAPATSCPGGVIRFANTGTTPVSSFWDFGDGTSARGSAPVKSYANPGTYTVTLTNKYKNCEGTTTKTITVAPPPVIGFVVSNDSGCTTPHTAQFTDTTTGSSGWLWDFGDGATSTLKNPAHTYSGQGNYTVTLTLVTAGGCSVTATRNNAVVISSNPATTIDAPSFNGCVPFNFQPTVSSDALGTITGYAWNFGDGATSAAATPSHIYTVPGTYQVSVQITTSKGCVVSYTSPTPVRTGTKPTVDFTANTSNACAGAPVQLQSLATPADAWQWNFGDGTVSTLENPEHQFEKSGSMTVTLIAFNNGCADTLVKGGFITTRGPVASFTAKPQCSDQRIVTFTNTSVPDLAVPATTYTWDFGDGSTPVPTNSLNPPLTHTYSALNNYTVKLVADNGDCQYERKTSLDLTDLNPAVTIKISKPSGIICHNESVRFTAGGFPVSRAKSYQWFINGHPAGSRSDVMDSVFSNPGTYTVYFELTDIYDCVKNSPAQTFTVTGVTADFTVANNGGCKNIGVSIQPTSVPADSISKWTFDFGDGTTETFAAEPISHVYANNGLYTIKMTAEDANGCTTTMIKQSAANITRPVANFSAEDTAYCQGTTVQFINNTNAVNLTYTWDFGDGTQSHDQYPSHVYTGNDSAYTVMLIATDANHCSDTLTQQSMIRIVKPKFTLHAKDTLAICPPLLTSFSATTSEAESVRWNFGDGGISTQAITSNFYDNYGIYEAKLYVYGYHGCIDSASQAIYVYDPQKLASVDYTPVRDCNSLNADFTVVVPTSILFTLSFGDGAKDSSQTTSLSHFYKQPGMYRPSLLLTDPLDCQVTVMGKTTIQVNGIYPEFNISKKQFCDTGTVAFDDFSLSGLDTILTHTWSTGDGTVYSGKNVTHHYDSIGTFLVTEHMTTIRGCENTITDTVRVFRTPQPVINGMDEICVGTITQYSPSTIIPDTLSYWRWTLENGQVSTETLIVRTFSTTGPNVLKLHAENKLGCGKDTSLTVTVWPTPVISHVPEIVIPVGGGGNLPIEYSPNVISYLWTPATSLDCNTCPQPLASPKFNTTYKVEVTDDHNCKASSTIVVKTVCNDQNYFVPNTFSPNNDGQNDLFYPRGTFLTRIQSMRIFNRWGELVFEKKNFSANDKSAGWDGKIRGMDAHMDTYVYIIEIVCENAQIVPLKGNVTLIR